MASHEDVMDELLRFREKRDWRKFHTPENLSKSISIEAAELLELFQWNDIVRKEDIENELADVLIYSFLLADAIGADPMDVMRKKLATNEARFPVDLVKGTSGKATKVSFK